MEGVDRDSESNRKLIWRGACGSLRIEIPPERTYHEMVKWVAEGRNSTYFDNEKSSSLVRSTGFTNGVAVAVDDPSL